ncbi:MAG: histidinol dehydrogenase [Crocinitomicaceae bacterium]|nr:histidinol dehydrogenase [Crocinitomicaceae bacterium]
MKTYLNPSKEKWEQLTKRPELKAQDLNELVASIFQTVEKLGDAGVRGYTTRFDQVEIFDPKVTSQEIDQACDLVPQKLKDAIETAEKNIRRFHTTQAITETTVETQNGVKCWRETRAIEKVGLYIPGGTAPLFSTVLMLGIPAQIAGCDRIVLCTPPSKDGSINPAILFAAQLVGITEIYKVGGVQAIAALAQGTESIPKVDKIFGPGNQYVTAAKSFALTKGVAIDMPAGPSEVLVIADETSDPSFVAADLLSQAEHGADSQVILLSTSEIMLNRVQTEIEVQLASLPRMEIAIDALNNSSFIQLETLQECLELSNKYAPEHLILAFDSAKEFITQITNAGSVFIGKYSCESAGDYASGTNHTLPTNGYARNYSGVSLDSFIKKITFQELSASGIQTLGPAIEIMAEAEQLIAHKNAVSIRLKALANA